jgi:hypothetical protein
MMQWGKHSLFPTYITDNLVKQPGGGWTEGWQHHQILRGVTK